MEDADAELARALAAAEIAAARLVDESDDKTDETDETDETDTSCVVCMDADRTHACVPCGHRCVCDKCVEKIRHLGACPVCRNCIDMCFRVYM